MTDFDLIPADDRQRQLLRTALRQLVVALSTTAALALAGWRAMADHHDLGVTAVISCGANIDQAVVERVLSGV